MQISYTRRPTSIIGPSFRARSSSDWWQRTSHTSRTKRKWQEEAFLRLQQYFWHHQHFSIHPLTKKRNRDSKKLSDEAIKKREDKFEEYRDLFAKDFLKGIAAHYLYLSQSIITDLERAIENIVPATTNDVMTHYRVIKDRLFNNLGPTRRRMPKKQVANWKVYTATIEDGTFTWRPWTP